MTPATWKSLHGLLGRFDNLSSRERVLIALALCFSLFFLWNAVAMQPLDAKRIRLQMELNDIADQTAAAAAAVQAALEPSSTATQELRQARDALEAVDKQLSTTVSGMVPPQQMNALLRDLVTHHHGIKLIELRHDPVTSLLSTQRVTALTPATTMDNQGPAAQGPYVHPVTLVIEGSYGDVVEYLQSIEQLPWKLYWNHLEMHADFPICRVRIEISTLGLTDGWMTI